MKDRNISIADYLSRLQIEYIIYELRSKIYPAAEDKEKFKEVMGLKRMKIEDISEKNNLQTIFTSTLIKNNLMNSLFEDKFVPDDFHGKDKYFYLYKNTDFSYKGNIVKLISYDLHYETAIIATNGKQTEVNLVEIRRIL